MRNLLTEEHETLAAVGAITTAMSADQWNDEIMRLFWGWFSSEHSAHLGTEEHETVITTIWGLTDFFSELAAIEARKEARSL